METSAFDDLLDTEIVTARKGKNGAEKLKEPTVKMKQIKAHLDVIAVSLIIIVSLYKIYDLSRK